MRRYLGLFRGRESRIALAGLLLAAAGLLPGASVWLTRDIVDRLVAGAPVATALAALLGVQVAHAALLVLRARVTRALAWSMVHEVRCAAHRAWHGVPPADVPPAGVRLASLTSEADELQYGVSGLVSAARDPIAAAVLFGSAAWMAPGLALRFAVLAPGFLGLALLGGWVVRRASARWCDDRAALVRELQDQHAGLPTTRDLGAEDVQIARIVPLSRAEADSRARLEWIRAVPTGLVQVGLACAFAALVAWGEGEVRAGRATVGGVVGFAVALALLHRPLSGLVEAWSLLQRSRTALARVAELLDRPASPRAAKGSGVRLAGVDVPGRLRGVDLEVSPGEKVAICGPSGAGKSSLLAVLAGDLAGAGEVRGRGLLLRQDPWVFDRSVADNLRLAAPDATDDRLREVLREVGLDVALERGLGEAAGERGGRFSGGERQRLCLARALLAAPEVLLADEPSSELDPGSAAVVAERLAEYPGAVIAVAHDGHFAARAARIVRLEGGRIVA